MDEYNTSRIFYKLCDSEIRIDRGKKIMDINHDFWVALDSLVLQFIRRYHHGSVRRVFGKY